MGISCVDSVHYEATIRGHWGTAAKKCVLAEGPRGRNRWGGGARAMVQMECLSRWIGQGEDNKLM
jgi:hypothetical protein